MNHLQTILLCLLCWTIAASHSLGQQVYQYQDYKITHYSIKEGLPDNNVRAVAQDSKGFLWFTTNIYLVRFDGYEFKSYIVTEESALTSGELLVDSQDNIWIPSLIRGLFLFNPETEQIVNFQHNPDNPNSISNNSVRKLVEDRFGNIWAGTTSGLNRLRFPDPELRNQESVVVTRWHAQKYPPRLRQHINNLLQSKTPIAAITQIGDNENRSRPFELKAPTQLLIFSMGDMGTVSKRLEDVGWITDEEGVKVWEMSLERSKNAGGYTHFREQAAMIDLPPGRYTLHFRTDGSFALGSWPWDAGPPDYPDYWGIQVLAINGEEQAAIQSMLEEESQPFLSGNVICDLFADRDGHLWVGGTDGLDQIFLKDANGEPLEIIHYGGAHSTQKTGNYDYQNLQVLEEQDSSLLLLGNRFGEEQSNFLTEFRKDNKHYGTTIELGADSDFFLMRHQAAITDFQKTVWYGATNGLFFNQRKTSNFPANILPFFPSEFGSLFIWDLYLDREGGVWVASSKGLYRIKYRSTALNFVESLPGGNSDNDLTFQEDLNQRVWMGERGRLLQFDPKKKDF